MERPGVGRFGDTVTMQTRGLATIFLDDADLIEIGRRAQTSSRSSTAISLSVGLRCHSQRGNESAPLVLNVVQPNHLHEGFLL